MKKFNTKELMSKLLKVLGTVGSKINLNTWYFTIIFFVCILFVSVWVWWQCFQNPFPSSSVLVKMEQEKENYTEMKAGTEGVITTLQESRQRFENPPFFGNQRELFLHIDLEDQEADSFIIPKKNEQPAIAEQPSQPKEAIVP